MRKAEAIQAAPTPGGETVQGDDPTQLSSVVKHCKPASDGVGHSDEALSLSLSLSEKW